MNYHQILHELYSFEVKDVLVASLGGDHLVNIVGHLVVDLAEALGQAVARGQSVLHGLRHLLQVELLPLRRHRHHLLFVKLSRVVGEELRSNERHRLTIDGRLSTAINPFHPTRPYMASMQPLPIMMAIFIGYLWTVFHIFNL